VLLHLQDEQLVCIGAMRCWCTVRWLGVYDRRRLLPQVLSDRRPHAQPWQQQWRCWRARTGDMPITIAAAAIASSVTPATVTTAAFSTSGDAMHASR